MATDVNSRRLLQKCGVLRESDGCRVAYRVPQQSGEWILELQTMLREDITITNLGKGLFYIGPFTC